MNTSFNPASQTSILDNYVAVLKKYNDFSGRARRGEFWDFVIVNVVVAQVLNLINALLFNGATLTGALTVILALNVVTLLPSAAVFVRRMHDVGKSGWYVLIPVYSLILAYKEGDKGLNKYGTDPKKSL
ncbi:DUF805 domain-containing protein [Spirosoma daeguense]